MNLFAGGSWPWAVRNTIFPPLPFLPQATPPFVRKSLTINGRMLPFETRQKLGVNAASPG